MKSLSEQGVTVSHASSPIDTDICSVSDSLLRSRLVFVCPSSRLVPTLVYLLSLIDFFRNSPVNLLLHLRTLSTMDDRISHDPHLEVMPDHAGPHYDGLRCDRDSGRLARDQIRSD